jgi:hypothetical protein
MNEKSRYPSNVLWIFRPAQYDIGDDTDFILEICIFLILAQKIAIDGPDDEFVFTNEEKKDL